MPAARRGALGRGRRDRRELPRVAPEVAHPQLRAAKVPELLAVGRRVLAAVQVHQVAPAVAQRHALVAAARQRHRRRDPPAPRPLVHAVLVQVAVRLDPPPPHRRAPKEHQRPPVARVRHQRAVRPRRRPRHVVRRHTPLLRQRLLQVRLNLRLVPLLHPRSPLRLLLLRLCRRPLLSVPLSFVFLSHPALLLLFLLGLFFLFHSFNHSIGKKKEKKERKRTLKK